MDDPFDILIIEDEEAHARALERAFKALKAYQLTFVSTLEEMRKILKKMTPHLILSDINLPDGKVFEILSADPENLPYPIIAMTSFGDEETAVHTLKSGALDYIAKSEKTFSDIPRIVERVLREWQNIQKRKQMEKQLRDSEEDFRTLFDTMAQGVIYQDVHGKIISANHAAEHIFGISLKSMIGKNVFDSLKSIQEGGTLFPEKIHPSMQALKTGNAVHNVLMGVLNSKTEQYRWIIVNAIPRFKEGNGAPFCVCSTFTDITERKQMEDLLASEKELLAVTLASIGDGVITTDIFGKVVLMNSIAEKLTGWALEDAQGKSFSDIFRIVDELTQKPCINPMDSVLATGKISELDSHTLLISRNGTKRLISDSVAPIKNQSGKILGIVLVFRDITEKQKWMDSVQNNQKLESLGTLAGGIAHDFNNLLGGVLGFVDLANMITKDKQVSDYLTSALDTLSRAKDLTQQLLTFAQGGSPVRKLESLFPFISETIQFALSGSQTACHFDIQEDLWLCHFDRIQIRQVINNIILNARQAMPKGGNITLKAANVHLKENNVPSLAEGNYIKISIEDTGCGITPEVLPKIFDPFFTTTSQGKGLGLTICYSIIKRHGGVIEAFSKINKGSCFVIYLPAYDRSLASFDISLPGFQKKSGEILLMDDEEVIQKTVSAMLKNLGYSVTVASNGEEVLQLINERSAVPFTAMILDLTIPGAMGGKEAIQEIRKRNIRIPVFVSSGYSEDPLMSRPEQYGFTASLKKPFRMAELSKMLNQYLK